MKNDDKELYHLNLNEFYYISYVVCEHVQYVQFPFSIVLRITIYAVIVYS